MDDALFALDAFQQNKASSKHCHVDDVRWKRVVMHETKKKRKRFCFRFVKRERQSLVLDETAVRCSEGGRVRC